jgi:dipeptidyl aminopeptidase/acylaminoacyl peptidase
LPQCGTFPVHHIQQICCPVLFSQGLEGPIVPPNQAEQMVEALHAKKIPVAYVPIEGEGHGFHQAAIIKRTLGNENSFYAQIFGILPPDPVEPVCIENFQPQNFLQ